MLTTLSAVIIIMLLAAYYYFIYSPLPQQPTLYAKIQQGNIQMGRHTRTFLNYVPQNLGDKPALVIALHGSGMNANRMRKWTGYEFDKLADQYGFIIVYPDGYKGTWNDCRINSPYPASKENIDDVGFVEQLIKTFYSSHHISLDEVYVFGFSNGGQMAFRLAIERPALIAAVCAVAASLPEPDMIACKLDGNTPKVMLIAGTEDPINPYSGGAVSLFGLRKVGISISAIDTARSFVLRNDLADDSKIIHFPILQTKRALPLELRTWGPSDSPFVKLYTVIGGGHVIPQPQFRFSRLMGKTAVNFNSPLKAMEFFKDRFL